MDNLNKQQKAAVEHGDGPLLIAAGAGSGKTKSLTSRLRALIYRGISPEKIIAITFTNKAADEMRERVFGNSKKPHTLTLPIPGTCFIGTFHSLGYRILRQEVKSTNRRSGFTVFDGDDSLSLVKKICKAMDLPKERFRPIALAAALSDIKSELKNPDELINSDSKFEQVLVEVFRRYETELEKNNAFDFDDLITKVIMLFNDQPALLEKYQNLFSHILVDEYQDINTAQYQLVRLLSLKHQNVSVVGDDAQAIYSFRGADFRNFLNFERDWPNATVIKLEQNYRSTKTIISAASALIENNTLQKPKTLWTENAEGEKISLVSGEDPDTEAIWIANEIRAIRDTDPKASIALLYRINASSRSLEQALISENLPYQIFGGLKFYERKEIKDVVASLRLAANPHDSLSKERLEKSLGKRLSAEVIKAMLEAHTSASIIERINLFLTRSHYHEILMNKFQNPQERLENIAELVDFAAQFEKLEDFLERVSLLQAADEPSEVAATEKRGLPVNLMTIHIAKGLEFTYVFVVGVNEGVLPHQKAMTRMEEIEEERRLLYVAMTRARKKLYLLFHAFPSRFLYEIPSELFDFVSATGMQNGLPDQDDMYLE